MCGDVGFSDKLFRCSNCRNRFQHSYCSSYYRENAEPIEKCDWCRCEERDSSSRSAHSGDKFRPHYGGEAAEKVAGKIPSPRTTTRRYKLLKDVMC
ncbi:hypothetical protein PHJA_001254900 [Phtheirospermum japonicum]|uniref:PHD-type zinc finger plants domain-containing protein n=1 Tax=Phtheirospermum japonicum TaxID=374723 RepID=A0A830BXC9_9LAMI|nr:hypothetical protein PHJA_001254900 [Phtheirospermum japonicum]